MSDEPVVNQAAPTTRRAVFAGAGAVGAVAVLAACGTDAGTDPYTGEPVDGAAQTPGGGASETPSAPPAEEEQEGEGQAEGLIATEEVEVGGGVLVNDEIVVTQPTAGEWRGFSAICTHQGCTVTGISDGTINCDCHGSRFSIEDGSVVQAAQGLDPSQQDPLPAINVQVADGWVVQA